MLMQQQIERDLKTALLSGNKEKVETLKSIKSALQYEAVAQRLKIEGLSDSQIQLVLSREAKKRQEAYQLYSSAGETDRADKELREKELIQVYLPDQISEDELSAIVATEIKKFNNPQMSDMGRIIGAVKTKTQGAADGGIIARMVKQALEADK
jgi:uncharacterized protein